MGRFSNRFQRVQRFNWAIYFRAFCEGLPTWILDPLILTHDAHALLGSGVLVLVLRNLPFRPRLGKRVLPIACRLQAFLLVPGR